MPRQKVYDNKRVQVQVRMPAKLRDRLNVESQRRFVSKTALVERALEMALLKWEKEKL
jgi:hypothetical protein